MAWYENNGSAGLPTPERIEAQRRLASALRLKSNDSAAGQGNIGGFMGGVYNQGSQGQNLGNLVASIFEDNRANNSENELKRVNDEEWAKARAAMPASYNETQEASTPKPSQYADALRVPATPTSPFGTSTPEQQIAPDMGQVNVPGAMTRTAKPIDQYSNEMNDWGSNLATSQSPEVRALGVESITGGLKSARGLYEDQRKQESQERIAATRAAASRASAEKVIAAKVPMPILEWQAFEGMTSEQQDAYLTMKRANPKMDLGGSVAITSPISGEIKTQYEKTLAPNDELDYVKSKAQAEAIATATGKTIADKTAQIPKLREAVSNLKAAIAEGGALSRSTGSGAGALADMAGNFVGYATEGSKAIAELQPVADLVLKMVPRFEGPQSNQDVASYYAAAGKLADPTVPVATRKQAAETIIRLFTNRENQFEEAIGGEPINSDTSNTQTAPAGGFTENSPAILSEINRIIDPNERNAARKAYISQYGSLEAAPPRGGLPNAAARASGQLSPAEKQRLIDLKRKHRGGA